MEQGPLVESYYVTKGSRVLSAALNYIFYNGFEREGINPGSAYSEYESAMMQAYHIGYGSAMGGALIPAYYAKSLQDGALVSAHNAKSLKELWPLAIPAAGSLIAFIVAYKKWFSSIRALKSQIRENAKEMVR